MMKRIERTYNISHKKEEVDSGKLVEIIKNDGWVSDDMIIVNCLPTYSSGLTQYLNHKLSHLNKNQLYEVMYLEMPYPNTSQVWNSCTKELENFEFYLKKWVVNNIFFNNFLFILSDVNTVRNFNKIRLNLRGILDREYFRLAAIYAQKGVIPPDYYVEQVEETHRVLFQWENIDNSN